MPLEEKVKEKTLPTITKTTLYDKEWLRKVLRDECPMCEGVLEKKGIRRNCTTNDHLTIYGNPVLVAYQKEVEITYPPIRYDQCPECGSLKFIEDEDRHEIVCGACGIVLAGPYQYGISYPWHERYVGVE